MGRENFGNYIHDKTESESGTLKTLSDLIGERGRLLSLWDLVEFMKDFDVNVIIDTMLSLGAKMPPVDAAEWVKHDGSSSMNDLLDFCKRLELTNSAKNAGDLIALVGAGREGAPPEMGQFHKLIDRLASSLKVDLSTRSLLYIEPRGGRLWGQPLDGWGDVLSVLPECGYDIEEAAKCLSLDRSTASAFHSMRVVEVGLKHLWKNTGLKPTAKDWGAYLAAIDGYAPSRPNSIALQSVSNHLKTIKNAWRNPTMHVEAKYTEEEAADIYNALKPLMKGIVNL